MINDECNRATGFDSGASGPLLVSHLQTEVYSKDPCNDS